MAAITVLDGGIGKELLRIGAPFRQPEWSALALMEAPEMVALAHGNFVDAGAHVITTNNYAVVPYHIGDELFDERGRELVRLSGMIARAAADAAPRQVEVAGSLPPLFGSYEPDRFDRDRAVEMYATIVEDLDPFVDVWLAETLSLIDEMNVVADTIADRGSGRPLWVSFSLSDRCVDGRVAIRSGASPTEILDAALGRDAIDAVLFNCSPPEQIGPAIDELAAAISSTGASIGFGAYANAFPSDRGEGYRANEVVLERRSELTADYYATIVEDWVDAGATIVGGCCDMYPEHIAALVARFA